MNHKFIIIGWVTTGCIDLNSVLYTEARTILKGVLQINFIKFLQFRNIAFFCKDFIFVFSFEEFVSKTRYR